MKPKITVAIPTYNRGTVVLDTIKDLFNQTEKNFEIIIVDQSTERTKSYISEIEKFQKDIRFRYYLVSPPNVTTARNFALSKAQSKYIVFLDDDVILKNDLLLAYIRRFEKTADISAIGGRVMQDGFPIRDDILHFDELTISHGVFTSTKSGYTNAFAGGNCALKVADALAVGGFDTKYRTNAFREESDMSLKMSRAGMKIYYDPKAELLHLASPRGGNRVNGDIWDHFGTYVNEMYFTLRYAAKGKKFSAIRKKYSMYCLQVRHFAAYKRRAYFIASIPASLFRMFFVRQRDAKELV